MGKCLFTTSEIISKVVRMLKVCIHEWNFKTYIYSVILEGSDVNDVIDVNIKINKLITNLLLKGETNIST